MAERRSRDSLGTTLRELYPIIRERCPKQQLDSGLWQGVVELPLLRSYDANERVLVDLQINCSYSAATVSLRQEQGRIHAIIWSRDPDDEDTKREAERLCAQIRSIEGAFAQNRWKAPESGDYRQLGVRATASVYCEE